MSAAGRARNCRRRPGEMGQIQARSNQGNRPKPAKKKRFSAAARARLSAAAKARWAKAKASGKSTL